MIINSKNFPRLSPSVEATGRRRLILGACATSSMAACSSFRLRGLSWGSLVEGILTDDTAGVAQEDALHIHGECLRIIGELHGGFL